MKIYCTSDTSNIIDYAEQFAGTNIWVRVKGLRFNPDAWYYFKFRYVVSNSQGVKGIGIHMVASSELKLRFLDTEQNLLDHYKSVMRRTYDLATDVAQENYTVVEPLELLTDDDIMQMLVDSQSLK